MSGIDFRMHSLTEQQRGRHVPHVVEPDAGRPGMIERSLEHLAPPAKIVRAALERGIL